MCLKFFFCFEIFNSLVSNLISKSNKICNFIKKKVFDIFHLFKVNQCRISLIIKKQIKFQPRWFRLWQWFWTLNRKKELILDFLDWQIPRINHVICFLYICMVHFSVEMCYLYIHFLLLLHFLLIYIYWSSSNHLIRQFKITKLWEKLKIMCGYHTPSLY